MIRSGRMRSELRTSSRIATSPSPSMFFGPRLEPQDVPLVEPQLGGVLDRDDPVAVRDRGRERVQQRRLAGAGAAGDQDVQLGLDAALEEVDGLGRERAEPDQVVEVEPPLAELADRDAAGPTATAAG